MIFLKPYLRLIVSSWLVFTALIAQAALPTGPTIRLGYGRENATATSVSDFMYFVALISPAPVYIGSSPNSSLTARLIAATRKSGKSSFVTTCEFQFSGNGLQESIFDLSPEIRRREHLLKAGGVLGRQLESIVVNGAGAVSIEARGSVSNEVRTVNEVRIKFNPHGQESFVSITLCDVRWAHDRFNLTNEVVARVNSLTFHREPGIPKMDITVASLKEKEASDGLWQSFKGRVEGAAVNLFIPPLVVEVDGNTAMLDFGLALAAGDQTFTFPQAKGLLAKPAPQISLLSGSEP
jgi:hypothetical protein